MTKVVVLQSNYIPWKGYFDLIKIADVFVVYDSVQYTKNDWRNRNLILGANGPIWLTIPVKTSGKTKQSIYETQVVDGRWTKKHWASIEQNLSSRPHFGYFGEAWCTQFELSSTYSSLHEINFGFMKLISSQLNLKTEIIRDSELQILSGTPTDRLVSICKELNASEYITGPRGLDYLDTDRFKEEGILLSAIDYSNYPTYEQGKAVFSHNVSVLDLMANVGSEATLHLQARAKPCR